MTPRAELGTCDQARKKDIDFSLSKEDYDKAFRLWELKIEKKKPKNKKEQEIIKDNWYKDSYYLKKFGTKENYANLQGRFSTFAVLKEGKWFESGTMGWFGCSSATPRQEGKFQEGFYERFIKDLPSETKLTMVDCHI